MRLLWQNLTNTLALDLARVILGLWVNASCAHTLAGRYSSSAATLIAKLYGLLNVVDVKLSKCTAVHFTFAQELLSQLHSKCATCTALLCSTCRVSHYAAEQSSSAKLTIQAAVSFWKYCTTVRAVMQLWQKL